MKVFKIIMNVLGIIAAAFLSILLVLTLVATPMLSAVSAFFKGENIHKLLSGVNYARIIEMKMDEFGTDGKVEIEAKIINDIVESDMMKDVVELCTNHIFEAMDGNTDVAGITAEDIEKIADEHMDDLKKIVRKNIGGEIPLTDETLEEMTKAAVKEYSVEIVEMLPTPEDVGLSKEVISILTNLRNGTFFWIMFAVAAVLTLLVMLCQVMRFKGFMWIGVDYLIAAVGTVVLAFTIKVSDFATLLGEMLIGNSILSTTTGIISAEMLKGAGIMTGFGILFIVIFVVGRKKIKKKTVNKETSVQV